MSGISGAGLFVRRSSAPHPVRRANRCSDGLHILDGGEIPHPPDLHSSRHATQGTQVPGERPKREASHARSARTPHRVILSGGPFLRAQVVGSRTSRGPRQECQSVASGMTRGVSCDGNHVKTDVRSALGERYDRNSQSEPSYTRRRSEAR